ncbi:MAG TPA: hypothetical protein VMS17_15930 [Gemmataceae bacterium]|nr:hypothetical protein [Gemmataceae bacterium]
MSSARRGVLFGLFLLAVPAFGEGEGAPPGPDAPPVMPPADAKVDPALSGNDRLIVLTPEELQKRLDKARQEGRTPLAPTECRLQQGEIKNGFALFEAEFDFHAERADAVFALACGQAKVTAVKKPDGRTPMLSGDANGYYIQVEQPGDCTVTLSLSVPLSQRPGGGRGLDLTLPRSVVTEIGMALPPDARTVRINGKDAADMGLDLKEHRSDKPPGAVDKLLLTGWLAIGVDKLDLSWQGPPGNGVQPLRTVSNRATVRVEGGATTAEAELVLHAQGEPAGEWTVIAPRGYEVKPSAADQLRIKFLTHADDAAGVAWTVVLKAPSGDDLRLTATPAPGQHPSIGPFLVRGANRQSGVVLVSAVGPDAHPVLHPHPDLAQRDLTDEERKADVIAAYEFAAAPAQPWLTVEAGAAATTLKVRTAYAFSLDHSGHGRGLEWQATAKFIVSGSGRTPIDHLDVQLPPGCQLLPFNQPDVTIAPDNANPQLLHVSLAGAAPAGFNFSIKAKYTAAFGPQGQREPFALPYLVPSGMLGIQDAGAQIDATAAPDLELLAPPDADVKDPHHFLWQTATTGRSAELSWQPYTPEVVVSSLIDLTFHDRTAEVRQELRLHFTPAAPTQLTLRTPAALGDSLKVVGQGAVLADDPTAPAGTRILKLLGSGADQAATLQYTFPLTPIPGEGAAPSVVVPLAAVDQAKVSGEQRVRVWCEAGRLPQVPSGDWSPEAVEKAPDMPQLPVLVLHSLKPDAPLTLTFSIPGAAATVLVDRALLRADLKGDAWAIQASYLIRQVAHDALDVELPEGLAASDLHAKLDGEQAVVEAVEQANPDKATHAVARLRLSPRLFLKPAVLELRYKLPVRGVFQDALAPPRLIGDTGQAPTRWRITLPSDYVALAPEGGAAVDWTIGLRGPLPAPRLAVTNDELEQWFGGGDVKGDPNPPSLVAWGSAGQPVAVVFLPELPWMLICSLALVLFGLLLFALVRRSCAGSRAAAVCFWLLVLPLVPAIGTVWAFHPTILYAIAYGCEPGAGVLLLFAAFQALMLERNRRRIVFLPNFRRARTGSSLIRAGSNGSGRPPGEPSTVDAPRSSGSSQQPASKTKGEE